MTQLSLFDGRTGGRSELTVASPICRLNSPCSRKGRAVMGPPEDLGECVNRTIHCLTCGARGEESSTRAWAIKKGLIPA